MGLSSRELLLIIRARDDVSGTLARSRSTLTALGDTASDINSKLLGTGIALEGIGRGVRDAGLAILDFGEDAVSTFRDVSQEAAVIATQAQNLGLTAQDVLQITNDVGREYGTSLDGLRESLFEILSTVETDVPGAILILENLALAGVAGGTSSANFAETATAALNAFGLEAEDSLRVLDAMFRAVEQGQGTYENFASGFSTAIPAAQAFNQTMEDTFGAVAFVTKATGLSESEAGTAVARAFDLFRKASGETNVVENLRNIGVEVFDLNGEFRAILPIMQELDAALGDLTTEERSSALQEIFGPNVRAFRFLTPALEDMEAFEAVLGEVNTGISEQGGILGAYNLLVEESATKWQELLNLYEIFKQQVGQSLIPIFEQLVDWGTQLLDVWLDLDPAIQDTIVQVVAFAAAAAVVVGGIAAFIGSIATFAAVFKFLGIGFGTVIGLGAGVILTIAALTAAAILLIENWETVKSVVLPIIDTVVEKFQAAWEAFTNVLQGGELSGDSGFIGLIENIAKVIRDTVIPAVESLLENLQIFLSWAEDNLLPGLQKIWDAFIEGAQGVLEEVIPTLDAIITNTQIFVDNLIAIWSSIWPIIQPILSVMASGIAIIWDGIAENISTTLTLISETIQLVMNLIQGDWSAAWENVKNIFSTTWDRITANARTGTELIKGIFRGFKNFLVGIMNEIVAFLTRKGKDMIDGLRNAALRAWASLRAWLAGRRAAVRGFFSGAGSWLTSAGRSIINGLADGMRSAWSGVRSWVGGLGGEIINLKGPPSVDRRLLINNGRLIMEGLRTGMQDEWKITERFLSGLTSDSAMGISPFGASAATGDMGMHSAIARMESLMMNIIENAGVHVEGNLVVGSPGEVDDLDYWTKTRRSGMS